MKNVAWIALPGSLVIVTLLLWEDHQAHILGLLPWALILLCPIFHLFLHRGHGGGGSRSDHVRANGEDGKHRHPTRRPWAQVLTRGAAFIERRRDADLPVRGKEHPHDEACG